ncbi:glycoside hydrolase family 3 protein [Egibacter rhizosphaerae]|uniref:glycoside hydrolase family 3 protein n=1 Tax=Egibacter rhizosphaerae TaxID=1670831 RepID=UPI0013F14EA2|nr:glycoside hydrolase family 3 protein [Egibacter rhizosphaerae]
MTVLVLSLVLIAIPVSAQGQGRGDGPPPGWGTPPGHDPGDFRPGWADRIIDQMTLEEKVGQLFWTRAYGSHAHEEHSGNQSDYGVDTAAEVVEKYHLGGVLYFAWADNTDHPEQMAELSDGLQDTAIDDTGVPLNLSIDQEGGIVQRLTEPATVLPGNMPLGATGDADLATAQGEVLGQELRASGANTNFAPVVDVNTNPFNPVIGVRSIGASPDLVGDLGTAYTQGMQDAGVSATLKHFPGHGDTDTDSHVDLPAVTYDEDELWETHLAPFQQAIDEADPDAIMTAHIIVQAIDPDLPGTLSPAILDGLLRDEMGYDGVIVTDSLGMGGVDEWDDDEIPVMALEAGADVLLNPPDMDTSYEAVVDAVEEGELSEERIEESVFRILRMKFEQGLFDDPYSAGDDVMDHVGTDENLAVADEIGEKAATVVRNDDDLLPLDADEVEDVLVTGAGGPADALAERIEALGVDATVMPATSSDDEVIAAAEEHDATVASTQSFGIAPPAGQQALIEDLHESDADLVSVAVRNPYDIASFPQIDTYVATYGWQDPSAHGAVDVLFGEVEPTGTLPAAIPDLDAEDEDLYPLGHGLGY